MADAVASQVLYESASEYVVKLTNVSDGTGESGAVKVDVSALSPAATEVAIERIVFSTAGMGVRVLWDATADVDAWLIPPDQTGVVDFRQVPGGRLINNAGAGKTGDILFTTVGHTAGDTYAIILHCTKRALA